jgi:hypothetical protein
MQFGSIGIQVNYIANTPTDILIFKDPGDTLERALSVEVIRVHPPHHVATSHPKSLVQGVGLPSVVF